MGGELFFFFCQAELLISFPEGRGTMSSSLLTRQILHRRGLAGHPRFFSPFLLEAEPDAWGWLGFSASVPTIPLRRVQASSLKGTGWQMFWRSKLGEIVVVGVLSFLVSQVFPNLLPRDEPQKLGNRCYLL